MINLVRLEEKKCKFVIIKNQNNSTMKNLLYILLLSPLFFISSCKEEVVVHGCFDILANNYNEEALIDNNSCCYTCFLQDNNGENASELGTYCEGTALEYIITNGYLENNVHVWMLNGELVSPGTTGALPAYNANGTPLIVPDWYYPVNCY